MSYTAGTRCKDNVGCAHHCQSTDQQMRCGCRHGYRLHPDGKDCIRKFSRYSTSVSVNCFTADLCCRTRSRPGIIGMYCSLASFVNNRGGSRGSVTRVTSNPLGAAAYFMLLLCVLFRCRFVPLLEPNPGNFILPKAQTPSMLACFVRLGSQSHPL